MKFIRLSAITLILHFPEGPYKDPSPEDGSLANLPRLVSHAYRLYPIVDQIADKVCATMQTYHDRPSSREKDASAPSARHCPTGPTSTR